MRHGVKKGYLIEEALKHHLQALRDIPEEVIIPARLVITPEAMDAVADALVADTPPKDALRKLLAD